MASTRSAIDTTTKEATDIVSGATTASDFYNDLYSSVDQVLAGGTTTPEQALAMGADITQTGIDIAYDAAAANADQLNINYETSLEGSLSAADAATRQMQAEMESGMASLLGADWKQQIFGNVETAAQSADAIAADYMTNMFPSVSTTLKSLIDTGAAQAEKWMQGDMGTENAQVAKMLGAEKSGQFVDSQQGLYSQISSLLNDTTEIMKAGFDAAGNVSTQATNLGNLYSQAQSMQTVGAGLRLQSGGLAASMVKVADPSDYFNAIYSATNAATLLDPSALAGAAMSTMASLAGAGIDSQTSMALQSAEALWQSGQENLTLATQAAANNKVTDAFDEPVTPVSSTTATKKTYEPETRWDSLGNVTGTGGWGFV